jgi:hypothetical protein
MLALFPVIWCMQTALILEYQKSVDLHTPYLTCTPLGALLVVSGNT